MDLDARLLVPRRDHALHDRPRHVVLAVGSHAAADQDARAGEADDADLYDGDAGERHAGRAREHEAVDPFRAAPGEQLADDDARTGAVDDRPGRVGDRGQRHDDVDLGGDPGGKTVGSKRIVSRPGVATAARIAARKVQPPIAVSHVFDASSAALLTVKVAALARDTAPVQATAIRAMTAARLTFSECMIGSSW